MRRVFRTVSLALQSLLYAAAGVNHFVHTQTYTAIMPQHWSHPVGWVLFTGAAEIAGAIGLLIPQTRRAAAWAILVMLVVYFDVHIDMLRHADRFHSIPLWALWARIPMQFVLIAWAWMYTRPQSR